MSLPPPPGKLPPKKAPPGAPAVAPKKPTSPQKAAAPAPKAQPERAPAPPLQPKRPAASGADAALIRGLSENLARLMEAVAIYDELLTEENALLQESNAHGVAAMLDRKIAATQLYQDRLRAVLADPACTRALEPDQRRQVIVLVKAMEEKARENALLLKANMSAIEQVIDAVNMAARKMKRQEVGYSESGEIRETYGPSGSSMALNSNI